jgi:hypothetical protein
MEGTAFFIFHFRAQDKKLYENISGRSNGDQSTFAN